MKVIIQKPDLDTCLTALIMGVSETDEIIVSKSNASEEDLMNPHVRCIEAGGSGLVHLNNYDHHDADRYFPPACRQSYQTFSYNHLPIASYLSLERLVEYVCMIDDKPKDHPPIEALGCRPVIEFPSLSNIFSGMLLIEKNAAFQFRKGMDILTRVLRDDIDPFNTMPDIEEWMPYKKAKEENIVKVAECMKKAEFYTAKNGFKIGFVESESIGGIGTIYAQACDVAIMYNPAFGHPPIAKYTIAGNGKKVIHLAEHLNHLEQGWGGRETIIGSPRSGTTIKKKQVLSIVLERL